MIGVAGMPQDRFHTSEAGGFQVIIEDFIDGLLRFFGCLADEVFVEASSLLCTWHRTGLSPLCCSAQSMAARAYDSMSLVCWLISPFQDHITRVSE